MGWLHIEQLSKRLQIECTWLLTLIDLRQHAGRDLDDMQEQLVVGDIVLDRLPILDSWDENVDWWTYLKDWAEDRCFELETWFAK